MNINLTKLASKVKEKKRLKLGLNVIGSSAFRADQESSSEEEENISGREAVNRSIAREQAALRVRAAAAAAEGTVDPSLYDYDGAYDSFHSNTKKEESDKETSKESRYIGDLLKAADQRQQERDMAYERKIARDQAVEEMAEPDLRGKEKFITAAYKRKLEERKVWQGREEEQQKLEAASDVTKQSDGMASFYGNLTKNVAMGGERVEPKSEKPVLELPPPHGGMQDKAPSVGHYKEPEQGDETREALQPEDDCKANVEVGDDPEERRHQMRLIRERKVEAARARYFERHSATGVQHHALVS
jgi:coiled-coil domain-containing protein 55